MLFRSVSQSRYVLGISLNLWSIDSSLDTQFSSMIATNKFSSAFSTLFISLTIFLVAMSDDFYKDHPTKFSDFIAIKLFLLTGAVAMVSFTNLAMFFLGIEVLSISVYILAASERLNVKSNEAGMKYFLLGSFASGLVLFGIRVYHDPRLNTMRLPIANSTVRERRKEPR